MAMRRALAGLILLASAAVPAAAAPMSHADADAPAARAAADEQPACSWPSGVKRCTRIASPAKRLDCFDELTGHGN
jgi:hypothetical protein